MRRTALLTVTLLAVAPLSWADKDCKRMQVQVTALQGQIADWQRRAADNNAELRRLTELVAEQNALLKRALDEGIRFFVTSLGNPKWVVDLAHQVGGVVYHDVTEKKWALKGLEAGVDGLDRESDRAQQEGEPDHRRGQRGAAPGEGQGGEAQGVQQATQRLARREQGQQ